ncbi:MAG: peptidylprolyl isomerase [Chitinophagales bacterium]
MFRIACYLFSAWFLLNTETAFAQPQLADKIVGIVDERIVQLSELEAQYQQYTYQSAGPAPADLKCQIFDQFLTDKLLVRQAELDSVKVTDDEVEQNLDMRIRSFANIAGSVEKLEEYYGKSLVEIKEEFRDDIREKILADRERGDIVKDVKVTPSEVAAFFKKIPQDSLPYFNAELKIGQLVIMPAVDEEVREYAIQKISGLLERVNNGEDFASLASSYSDDPGSAEQGGDLGFVNRGEMDPNFEAAGFALKNPNDISDMVESKFGFHIIQLVGRRGDKIHLRHILIRPKITSYDIQKAGIKADSIYNLIQSGKYTFEQAVNKFSEDITSRENGGIIENPATGDAGFETADLGTYDQSLVPATDTLQVGAITRPIIFRTKQGETGFRMIYLKSKTRPHQANLHDDYDRIQQFATSQKQVEVITKWLEDRISRSYVFVAPEYQNCVVIKKWISKEQQ